MATPPAPASKPATTPKSVPEPVVDDDVLIRAQKVAPSLTAEFADMHGLTDEYLEGIASGLIPPPPTNGPIQTSDLHFVNGMWQQTPVGVAPEDVQNNSGAYGPKL